MRCSGRLWFLETSDMQKAIRCIVQVDCGLTPVKPLVDPVKQPLVDPDPVKPLVDPDTVKPLIDPVKPLVDVDPVKTLFDPVNPLIDC
ncbi:MAG: hypothetical protein KZQ96_23810 [Candidatus Thiodiazotropha sp. (ex Lucinoma borealis)]|nr:hypothetical protein [Candidatus Thiodiazotropha sp. (ex Lucinoma borealis)]